MTTSQWGATKAMAEALVRYLAVDLAPIGVRVNALSPTALDTEGFREIFGREADARLEAANRLSPSGRAVDLDDVVGVVEFLASPEAQMFHGQTFALDGGALLVG